MAKGNDVMGSSMITNSNEIRKRRSRSEEVSTRDTPLKSPKRHRASLPAGENTGTITVPYHFSSDMLHHIFGFYLSNTGKVDGDTLRSVMMVSKQWKEVATSSCLWSIQNGGSLTTMDTIDPIESALSITEVRKSNDDTSADDQDETLEELSLIGFTKIARIHDGFGDNSLVYRAKERSRGIQCIIAVSPKNQRSWVLLNHIYEAGLFRGGEDSVSAEHREAVLYFQKHYPLGVILAGDHVVRWHEDSDIIPNRIFPPYDVKPEYRESFQALIELHGDYCHLQCLERRQKSEITNHLPRQCWATIVDWLVEITVCFDLSSRVAYHAMELFRRFVSTVKVRVKVQHYQLIASACMFIACKCGVATSMKATDFIHCSDNIFTAKQLSATEDMVLVALDWKLAYPTTADFLQRFWYDGSVFGHDIRERVMDFGHDSRERMMMRYLAELSLQSQVHVDLEPSLIAVCVIVFARYCLQQEDTPLWKEKYERSTGYSFDKVCSGVVTLSHRLEEIRSFVPELKVIDRRYRVVSNTVAIPTITSPAVLIAYQARITRNNFVTSTPDDTTLTGSDL